MKLLISLVLFLTYFGLAGAVLGEDAVPSDLPVLVSPPENSADRGPGAKIEILSLRYVRRVVEDTGTIVTKPFRWGRDEWGAAVLVVGVTGGMMATDERTQRYFQDHRTDAIDRISKQLRGFGSEKGALVLGSFYLGGVLFKNATAYAVAADGLEASVIGALFSTGLKVVAGRSRPNEGKGSDDVHPFQLSLSSNQHDGHSFPSGHATEAFVIASVVTGHYDSVPVGIASYGLAGLVALSRVNDNAHFLSDVFFGGVLGTWIGKEVVTLNSRNEGNPIRSMTLVPHLDRRNPGVDLVLIF